MAQWMSLAKVLGSHLGTGSNQEQVFKGLMSRCEATTLFFLTNL